MQASLASCTCLAMNIFFIACSTLIGLQYARQVSPVAGYIWKLAPACSKIMEVVTNVLKKFVT